VTVTTDSSPRPALPAVAAKGRRLPPAWLIITGLTTAVIVFCTARGLAGGYEPIGDNAAIELRAWDVFTRDHHPLLGTASSASLTAGRDVNHPGPLLFDYLAIPVRVLGAPVGLAVGAAVLNLAAVWGSVLVARKVDGNGTATSVALAASVLVWTLGSDLLFDVWQPNILVLPFFAFLVLMWAVCAGRGRVLPVAVAVGSLCMQTHLSYLLLVPALIVVGVAALVVHDRGRVWARQGPSLLTALGVGVVLWAQPLWEQVFGDGRGNLSRLLDSAGVDENPRHGVALGVRLVGAVLAVPPWWVRPGFDDAVAPTPWVDTADGRRLDLDAIPSLLSAGFWHLLVAVVVGSLVVMTWRVGDRFVLTGAALASVAAVVCLVTVSITPLDQFGVSPHRLRWLWSLGAFVLAVVLTAVWKVVAGRSPTARPLAWAASVAAALGLSLATLPTYVANSGPVSQQQYVPLVQAMRRQLDPLEDVGAVVVDNTGLFFAEPYTWPLMAELARRGIEFEVETEGLSRHVGKSRLADGDAKVRVFLRVGGDAAVTPPGATLVAVAGDPATGPAVGVFIEPYPADTGDG
jgi:hypothetical protein